jgi:hypothetical protein
MKPANDQEKEDWYLDVSDHIEEHVHSTTDDYTSPWIDQSLLDYSLKGIESIKIF